MEPEAPQILELSYSLKAYLTTIWWPALRGCFMPCQAGPGRSRPWPRYEALQSYIGPGTLQKVTRLDAAAIQDGAARYFSSLPDVIFRCTPNGISNTLMLPNPDLTEFEDTDYHHFSNVENEEIFNDLMEKYVLQTVSSALAMIHRISVGAPLLQQLIFRRDENPCNVLRPRWELFYLPGNIPSQRAVAIFSLPPWDFGEADMDDLVMEQSLGTGVPSEDLFTQVHSAPNKLWAAIRLACESCCQYFVVTTYECWVFGAFNDDWTAAQVTPNFQTPIRSFFDRPSHLPWQGCNIIELLLYWIQLSRGAAPPLGSHQEGQMVVASEETQEMWV